MSDREIIEGLKEIICHHFSGYPWFCPSYAVADDEDEMAFLKGLIEKPLPPKGVL